MKQKITREDSGEIFSIRKGPNDEIRLKVKAEKPVTELQKIIGSKVEGVSVKELRKSSASGVPYKRSRDGRHRRGRKIRS